MQARGKESGRSKAEGIGERQWRAAAGQAVERSIRAGVGQYRRERQLPALIAVEPASLGEGSVAAAQAILSRLRRALRAERRRAKAGHWTYDLNRHIALRQAYAAEAARLAEIRTRKPDPDHCHPGGREAAARNP